MEDFYKQKICWKAVGKKLAFSLVEEGIFLSAPACFIASRQNLYILAFLGSKLGKYFFYQNSDRTGAGDIMLNIQSLVKFPIPKYEKGDNYEKIKNLMSKIIEQDNNSEKIQKLIDLEIYKIFKFNITEVSHIESV